MKPEKKKSDNCKSALLKTFLFFRYWVDILIDKIFGYFLDSKTVALKNNSNPIILESAVSLAKQIRTKKLSSEQVVRAFIERILEVNPILNALVDTRFEEALKEAQQIDYEINTGTADFHSKPFLGVPFTTKETTAVKGLSHTFGLLKRKNRIALYDADYVTLLKNAGAICLGVSNVPPLNLWQETFNPVYGVTRNPYDTTRNVGGSSGGESSILAAGGIPLSVGTDIGGSCRIPAFMCGVYGHKTTCHIISTKGMTFREGNEEQTMVAVGPMTRYAVDIIPLLQVLAAEKAHKLRLTEPVDVRKLKIYYILDPNDPFVSPIRQEMTNTLTKAVDLLTKISVNKPQQVEFENLKYTGKLWKFWMTQESNANYLVDIMNREGKANPLIEILKYCFGQSEFSVPTIFNFINTLLPNPKPAWAEAETRMLTTQLTDLLADDGVLLYPSSPWPASYHYTAFLRPWNFNLFSIWNVVKFPVTQVPMGLHNGLPVGIQVVAAPYQDRLCIAVAKKLEEAFGGYAPPFKVE